jgi:phosphoribosylanthranilate isomerase
MASIAEAQLAIAAGADAVGLVSAMPSGPGPIDEALIAEIAAFVPPPIATFLLTSLQDPAAIAAQHARLRTTTIQMVDELVPGAYAMLRVALPGTKLVQVIHVTGPESIDEARTVAPLVDALLLDSGRPRLAIKELGGTGRVHDWVLSRRIVETAGIPVFLAGGLSPENVRQAIAEVGPFGVDVCSGVRTGGRLDATKVHAFMRAVSG